MDHLDADRGSAVRGGGDGDPSGHVPRPDVDALLARPSPVRRCFLSQPHQFPSRPLCQRSSHVSGPVENGGNQTPFFFIPLLLAGLAAWFVLPLALFLAVPLGAAASFFVHVWFDRAYHVEGTWLNRFAWFRRKQQLHFVHHLHANRNFAVVDFFWDRVLGTYREPDQTLR